MDIEVFQGTTHSERATERIGERIAAGVAADAGRALGALVIALAGDLGAGKTRLVRGLSAGLGADPRAVASPTFVVSVEHPGADALLVHIDAWRLRSQDELTSIGWEELLARVPCVVAIEWPERIGDALPAKRIDVRIDHAGGDERHITITDRRADPSATQRLVAALAIDMSTSLDTRTEARSPLCPTCKTPVAPDAATHPFCSSRCRMADLGRWFRGAYSVSRPLSNDEELSE